MCRDKVTQSTRARKEGMRFGRFGLSEPLPAVLIMCVTAHVPGPDLCHALCRVGLFAVRAAW